MHRTLHLLTLLLAAIAAPAAAQIEPGQTVFGELSPGDPQTGAGAYYDAVQFAAEEGVAYVVTLESEDFDAYLWAGPRRETNCDPCMEDDDGLGGTDARLAFTAEATVPYIIRISSYDEGETGRYTLRLEAEGTAQVDTVVMDTTIYVPGDTVAWTTTTTDTVGWAPGDGPEPDWSVRELLPGVPTGRTLTGDAITADDGTYYQVWTYFALAGATVTFTMQSGEFDPVLRVMAWGQDGDLHELGMDDDGGEGTNSRLTVTFPEVGTYQVWAGALSPGDGGDYTISAAVDEPGETLARAPGGIYPGETHTRVLPTDAPRSDAGAPTEIWWFSGSAGETFTIDLRSGDFDTLLRVSEPQGEDGLPGVTLAEDDDGGEGTNSRITITLPDDGIYWIHAGPLFADGTGRYTISVTQQ